MPFQLTKDFIGMLYFWIAGKPVYIIFNSLLFVRIKMCLLILKSMNVSLKHLPLPFAKIFGQHKTFLTWKCKLILTLLHHPIFSFLGSEVVRYEYFMSILGAIFTYGTAFLPDHLTSIILNDVTSQDTLLKNLSNIHILCACQI